MVTATRRLTWQHVRDHIHDDILSGRYAPGDKLPRDADIAVAFRCARTTVQRAMQDLADSGIVERRRKGGTHVRPHRIARATLDIPITRLEVEQKGGRYGYRLIRRSLERPPPPVRSSMGLCDPGELLRLEALHLSDGRPYILEDRWVCPRTVPEILDLDLSAISANEWLVLNRPYSRFELRFHAEAATARVADLMATSPGAALLAMERTTWIEDAPITTVKALAAPGYSLLTRS